MSEATGAEKKAPADWELIEADYRAGVLSLREIAKKHGITEGAIRKRAKRDGWERDLTAKVQAAAQSLVRKETVRKEVRTESAYSETDIISVNGRLMANVELSQREDIAKARRLSLALLEELEGMTDSRSLLAELGTMLRSPDENDNDKRNDLYNKVISSAARIDGMKKIAETLRTLITLEREAYSLSLPPQPAQTTVLVQNNNTMQVQSEVREIVRALENEY